MSSLTAVPTTRPDDRGLRVSPSNPLRIGLIGVDHIQVFIRPAHGEHEFLALVDRLERLVDAGYETVDVVFESSSGGGSSVAVNGSVHSRVPVSALRDVGMFTDAATAPLGRG